MPISLSPPVPSAPSPPAWPATEKREAGYSLHGVTLRDDYQWLEDGDDPEVQRWMQAQDQYARHEIAKFAGRPGLVQRFSELFYVDSIGAPIVAGQRLFTLKASARVERAVLYVTDGATPGAPERVLIDPNAWGSISLGSFVPSQDGRLLVYKTHPNHADESDLHVMDVATGRDLPDVIHGAKYAEPSWVPDGSGFYYEWLPTDPSIPIDERPGYTEIRYHAVGTPAESDRTVRARTGDPTTFLASTLSKDGRWHVVYVQHGWSAVDVYVQDLHGGQGFVPFLIGRPHLYQVIVANDRFYVFTNEGADRYKVMGGSTSDWSRERWTTVIPEDPVATLQSVSLYGGHLALTYLKDATSRLRTANLDGSDVREIALPGLGAVSAFTGDAEGDDVYIQYSDFLTPRQVFRYSVTGRTLNLWANIDLPIEPARFTTEQVWFPSRDGTPIPMFLVHRRDLVRDGNNPTVLYGYGGFAVPMVPNFRPSIYPFLEAGGIWAVVNLRGGGEYGEAWHQAGLGANKQNVFDDFAGAARYLAGGSDAGASGGGSERHAWTSPARLAIMGGSNGGLLVGVAMTQHPELYKAVVCQVPLLDMIRYPLFGSGRTWVPEYGTPDDPDEFKTLRAYSPYHHVQAGVRYPALFMASSDHDDRVDPMHARKFVAEVQGAVSDGLAPIYLRIEANAGHGGADGVAPAVQLQADTWGFVMQQLGVSYDAIVPAGPPASPSPRPR